MKSIDHMISNIDDMIRGVDHDPRCPTEVAGHVRHAPLLRCPPSSSARSLLRTRGGEGEEEEEEEEEGEEEDGGEEEEEEEEEYKEVICAYIPSIHVYIVCMYELIKVKPKWVRVTSRIDAKKARALLRTPISERRRISRRIQKSISLAGSLFLKEKASR